MSTFLWVLVGSFFFVGSEYLNQRSLLYIDLNELDFKLLEENTHKMPSVGEAVESLSVSTTWYICLTCWRSIYSPEDNIELWTFTFLTKAILSFLNYLNRLI